MRVRGMYTACTPRLNVVCARDSNVNAQSFGFNRMNNCTSITLPGTFDIHIEHTFSITCLPTLCSLYQLFDGKLFARYHFFIRRTSMILCARICYVDFFPLLGKIFETQILFKISKLFSPST